MCNFISDMLFCVLYFVASYFLKENRFEKEDIEIKYLRADCNYFRHLLYNCGKQEEVINYDNEMNKLRGRK